MRLVRTARYKDIFEKYNPNLVFVSRVDTELDQTLLREAKQRKIKTVGMIVSWNGTVLSRYTLRLLPDVLVVWNGCAKALAEMHCDIPAKNIFVSGIPRLDRSLRGPSVSREQFCKKYSIEPSRKIILFISIPQTNKEESRILEVLDGAVKKGELPSDVVFLVRNHPIDDLTKGSMVRGGLETSPNIVYDNSRTFWENNKSYTDGLVEDIEHVVDSLSYAEMVLTTNDTMGVDARFLDTPVVAISEQSVESADELVRTMSMCLKNPKSNLDEVKEKVKEQYYKNDGKAGERIAKILIQELS